MNDIAFASPEAEEYAADNNVTADDLGPVAPSGENGYVKSDVEQAIRGREQSGDGPYRGSERLVMADGFTLEGDGFRLQWSSGATVRPAQEYGDRLLEERVAYPEDDPPACPYCTDEFTGSGAFKRRDEHIEVEHRRDEEEEE